MTPWFFTPRSFEVCLLHRFTWKARSFCRVMTCTVMKFLKHMYRTHTKSWALICSTCTHFTIPSRVPDVPRKPTTNSRFGSNVTHFVTRNDSHDRVVVACCLGDEGGNTGAHHTCTHNSHRNSHTPIIMGFETS